MEWSIQKKLDKQAKREVAMRKWRKHFAIFPVVIGSKKHWLETVYVRYDQYGISKKYCTLMDILREEQLREKYSGTVQGIFSSKTFPKDENEEDAN